MSLRPTNSAQPSTPKRILFPGQGSTLSGASPSPSSGGYNAQLRIARQQGRSASNGNTFFLRLMFYLSLALTYVSWKATLRNVQEKTASSSVMIPPANTKMAKTILTTPMGSLGPRGTNSNHFRYYDTLFHSALQFAPEAKTAIEVGCASDPFLGHLDWIEESKTCVTQNFVPYSGTNSTSTKDDGIKRIEADFMGYQLPNNQKFDLLICGQVLEHVPDPASFMKKLLATAKTAIISVPFDWGNCGNMLCNHTTHNILVPTVLKWSAPLEPIYQAVVTEDTPDKKKKKSKKEKTFNERLIVVYKAE